MTTRVVAPKGRGTYRRIGDAVRAAGPGDVVVVGPGTYAEDLVLDRSVALVAEHGAGSVVLTGTPGSGRPALTVQGLDCSLRGITVKVAGTETPAVEVSAGAGLLLEDCAVSGGRIHARGNDKGSDATGSDLAGYGTTTVVLRGSRIEDSRLAALHLAGRVRAHRPDGPIRHTRRGPPQRTCGRYRKSRHHLDPTT